MTCDFKIEKLKQGTATWLAWRRNGIGASDAPAIMGENPWKTPDEILADKMGLSEPYSNAVMERGSALEPEARRQYERTFGVRVKPACLKSVAHEWMLASVDGMAHESYLVVEIKCGESVYRHTASRQTPPTYYYGQLQHILAVTGYASIDFWCYLPTRPSVHVRVPRNQEYIRRLIETERAFWKRVISKRGPEEAPHRPVSRGTTQGD